MLEVGRTRPFSLSSRQFDSLCLLTKSIRFIRSAPCIGLPGHVSHARGGRAQWGDDKLSGLADGEGGSEREREKTTAGKGWVQGEKSQMKRVREREEGGLDRGQTDERTHLNKGSVILLSERKIEMVDLRIRTKQTTIRSIFFYRILSVGKVNRTMCHIRRQMFIQYLLQCYF